MYYSILSLHYLKLKNGSCIRKYKSRSHFSDDSILLLVLIVNIIFLCRLGNVKGMIRHTFEIY